MRVILKKMSYFVQNFCEYWQCILSVFNENVCQAALQALMMTIV